MRLEGPRRAVSNCRSRCGTRRVRQDHEVESLDDAAGPAVDSADGGGTVRARRSSADRSLGAGAAGNAPGTGSAGSGRRTPGASVAERSPASPGYTYPAAGTGGPLRSVL